MTLPFFHIISPSVSGSSGSSSRILESIEREEDKEARILAEAMTSVPEDEEEEDHEHIEGKLPIFFQNSCTKDLNFPPFL